MSASCFCESSIDEVQVDRLTTETKKIQQSSQVNEMNNSTDLTYQVRNKKQIGLPSIHLRRGHPLEVLSGKYLSHQTAALTAGSPPQFGTVPFIPRRNERGPSPVLAMIENGCVVVTLKKVPIPAHFLRMPVRKYAGWFSR